MDIEGYRPTPGDKDMTGAVIPDQHYNQRDFDANLVIDERTKPVAPVGVRLAVPEATSPQAA